jgi:HAE1 family hydrophobic/amphiphilic exporter-1
MSPLTVTPKDWNAKIVAWLMKNSYWGILLFITIVLAGTASFFSLKREGFPAPSIGVAVITAVYPGAGPEVVEAQLVAPLERAIQDIAVVDQITSRASSSFAQLTINFEPGTDTTAALTELRGKVQDVSLPDGVDRPEVFVPEIGGQSSFYALASEDANTDPSSLRVMGEEVATELESLDGVASFSLVSGVQDVVQVRWNADAMARLGVTPLVLQQALQTMNIQIPAGSITDDALRVGVVTSNTVATIEDIQRVPLQTTSRGVVRVSDVASVELVAKYDRSVNSVTYKRNGVSVTAPALIYELAFTNDADVLKVDEEVQKQFTALAETLKDNKTELVTLQDVAESTREQIDEIVAGAVGSPVGEGFLANAGYLLGGIWLIALAMLFFVSWRAAFISALAIPLSLLFTFAALQIQGIGLNTLTLFSLVLALGLLVDPAIVVIEAIQRELDFGKKPKDAVIAAMNTVGTGVFVAVLTSVIVFVPFGVVSGIFGEIIKYIPITIIPALIASYLVPVVFLTFMAGRFLKAKEVAVDDEAIGNLWPIARWLVGANMFILSKPWLQVTIIALAAIVPVSVAGMLFSSQRVVPVQFSAPLDATGFQITVDYPENTETSKKAELLLAALEVIKDEETIDRAYVFQEQRSSSVIAAYLVERSEREENSPEILDRLSTALEPLVKPELRQYVSATEIQTGTPATEYPVAVNIFGDDLTALTNAAKKTGDILRDQDGVTRVEDGVTNVTNPQIEVVLDKDKVSATGLSATQVAGVLAGIVSEQSVATFEETLAGASRQVTVSMGNATTPKTVGEIANTVLGASATGVIRVSDVASVRQTEAVSSISRLDGKRYTTVRAKVEDPIRGAGAPQKAIRDYWTPEALNEYGLRANALEDRGSGNEFVRSFQELFVALGVAMVLLYVTLVVFLRSFTQPFIILFAVPLTFVGVFPALTLVGGQFGFLEILGIITLSGIVVNVGIFLMDLANQKRAEGMDTKQAIAEAAGIRFRPIILTKITTLGGLLPLIILAPFWRSLSTVIVAGILVSGFLSLFTTPILYVWFIGAKQRILRGAKLARAARS